MCGKKIKYKSSSESNFYFIFPKKRRGNVAGLMKFARSHNNYIKEHIKYIFYYLWILFFIPVIFSKKNYFLSVACLFIVCLLLFYIPLGDNYDHMEMPLPPINSNGAFEHHSNSYCVVFTEKQWLPIMLPHLVGGGWDRSPNHEADTLPLHHHDLFWSHLLPIMRQTLYNYTNKIGPRTYASIIIF